MTDGSFLPELELLVPLLGGTLGQILAAQPGGWRTLSLPELEAAGVSRSSQQKVLALQELVRRGYPRLPANRLLTPDDVASVFVPRLGGLATEQLLVVALDGRNQLRGEFVVATGGCGSLSVTPADVMRPAIRAGARSIILVHNHPSGDPTPSEDDVRMTRVVADVADIVGIPLIDHVVVARDGFRSLAHIIESRKEVPTHVAAESESPTH